MSSPTKVGFFEESPGVFSMIRLVLFVLILLVVGLVGVLSYCAIKSPTHTFPDVPGGIAGLLGTVITATLAAKTFQAIYGENTTPTVTPPTS